MQQTVSHFSPLKTDGFAYPVRNVTAFGIQPGMKVADFGAGSGAYVFAIAEQLLGGGIIYAIDIQKDLLRRIKNDAHRRGFTNIDVIWADLEVAGASKMADASLDMVLISNLLFQLKDKAAPLKEARRILKPHGKLIVIDWSESFGGLGPIKEHVVSRKKALSLAAHAGFSDAEEFSAGAHHFGLILTSHMDQGEAQSS